MRIFSIFINDADIFNNLLIHKAFEDFSNPAGYPAEDFVLVTLNTLTKLAAATLVDIPSQVSLLLNYLKNDARWKVKLKALEHLYDLAKPGAHLWPPGSVEELIEYILETEQKRILIPALSE